MVIKAPYIAEYTVTTKIIVGAENKEGADECAKREGVLIGSGNSTRCRGLFSFVEQVGHDRTILESKHLPIQEVEVKGGKLIEPPPPPSTRKSKKSLVNMTKPAGESSARPSASPTVSKSPTSTPLESQPEPKPTVVLSPPRKLIIPIRRAT